MKLKLQYLPVVVLLIGLSGCKKKVKNGLENTNKKNKMASLAIPLAKDSVAVAGDESVRSFFDNDVNQFVAQDDTAADQALIPNDAKDFAMSDSAKDQAFGKVYFEFDKHEIRKDQEPVVAKNAQAAKDVVAQASKKGSEAKIVLEGHADTVAGSSAYNLALSEKRAKVEKDYLVAAGIPAENLTIVGRGNEVPEIVDGKPVVGDKDAQWLNRRTEVHVIYN